MTTAIEARGIAKRFRGTRVLDGLDLTVGTGTVFALLGPNGAGKTTTIDILTTLVRADAGTARVAGVDVRADPDAVRARISVTGQSAAVDGVLTGRENLLMLARLSGLPARSARSRADELLERFDLTSAATRRVAAYSGGMRRRLDLALSLVVPTPVVFLDEPTTGLDARSRRELWQLIREVSDAGSTVFLTTQYLEEADRLADRIAVLDRGRIAEAGTASELKSRVGGEVVVLLGADDEVLAELPTDGTVHALRAAVDELDRHEASAIDGTRVAIRRPSLDDVFLAITARSREPRGDHDLIGTERRP
ncbi:ATP-binding cassette domain-containing protein [Agromyces marinus]|uniref:Daunorubicin resistance protein DrrA family ABC transporter ATP-binding protein n=1 Tax=Agromyces marinus TaxID=1389020 RepID=A0ABM8GYR9_9MICO|nr:ATP-binding cassette domain-containing protein [Agromyces marinus]UIP58143.1 Daunorubicin/doxorubicin resistance ATP-binding protein DrrA [Agromyces marinus]BDZ53627.1 daunorubicin resistance protein DrrA family ABC transporter ATP-binding protein [Agromyces marinus]